jgi:hypothetical protein
MNWLDHSGTIVLGKPADEQHLTVSLSASGAADKWLDAIPAEHRAAVFTEVSRALSTAGVNIKRIITGR